MSLPCLTSHAVLNEWLATADETPIAEGRGGLTQQAILFPHY